MRWRGLLLLCRHRHDVCGQPKLARIEYPHAIRQHPVPPVPFAAPVSPDSECASTCGPALKQVFHGAALCQTTQAGTVLYGEWGGAPAGCAGRWSRCLNKTVLPPWEVSPQAALAILLIDQVAPTPAQARRPRRDVPTAQQRASLAWPPTSSTAPACQAAVTASPGKQRAPAPLGWSQPPPRPSSSAVPAGPGHSSLSWAGRMRPACATSRRGRGAPDGPTSRRRRALVASTQCRSSAARRESFPALQYTAYTGRVPV